MNSISVRMPGCRLYRCLPVLLACVVCGTPILAQTAPIVERLSPNTVFYAEWRGSKFLADAQQTNHVLQLLHDPAFMPIWSAATTEMQQRAQQAGGQAANPAVASLIPDAVSLLANPLAVGFVVNPAGVKGGAAEKSDSPFAYFVVFDATGKADLIEKWKAVVGQTKGTPSDVTKYDFGGTSVEVRSTAKNTFYSAPAGNYYVFSDQKQAIEDLIMRFRSADVPTASLTQIPEFATARHYVGDNAALQFFFRVPDMSQWNPTEKSAKSMLEIAKGIHLDKVHVMGGGVSFDGEATRMRGVVLGDTSPTGLFDLAGTSSARFQTQSVVEGGAVFSMSRMNYAAIYQVLRDAIFASLEPAQAAQVGALEGAAQGYLGMSIADALKLFTGEFASTTSYTDDGTPDELFAATIQRPDAVLRILRALIGSMIVSEDSRDTTTLLDVAFPYTDPATHQRRRKFYYVAVTPEMILAAPRKELLQETLERLSSQAADPPTGVFANPEYAQLRSALPEKLSGLGGADLTQIPWGKVIENFASQMAQAPNQTNGPKPLDLGSLKFDAISHYLHLAVSGWWKDANGVYFDSYIQ